MSQYLWSVSIPSDLNKLARDKMSSMKVSSKSEYIRYLMRKDLGIWGEQ